MPVIVVIKFLESFIKTLHLLIGQPVEDVLWAKKSPLITIIVDDGVVGGPRVGKERQLSHNGMKIVFYDLILCIASTHFPL